jgi:hypothetical protein
VQLSDIQPRDKADFMSDGLPALMMESTMNGEKRKRGRSISAGMERFPPSVTGIFQAYGPVSYKMTKNSNLNKKPLSFQPINISQVIRPV